MSDSDISAKGLLVKYKENGKTHFLHKKKNGDIVGIPQKKDALIFNPVQAKQTINLLIKDGIKAGPETVR